MKKLVALLCAGVLMTGVVGCGKTNEAPGEPGVEATESPAVTETPAATEAPAVSSEAAGTEGGHDYANGWTEEMEGLKAAVVEVLGENYWPNSALQPDMLEMAVGLTSDMYVDYLAEMPMISTNVDTLIIVKPAEGQEEAVWDALNAYRDSKVNDTMQYPMNIGKTQASDVEKVGNYICFVQLGADVTNASEEGDEAVIKHCQEANRLAMEALKKQAGE